MSEVKNATAGILPFRDNQRSWTGFDTPCRDCSSSRQLRVLFVQLLQLGLEILHLLLGADAELLDDLDDAPEAEK